MSAGAFCCSLSLRRGLAKQEKMEVLSADAIETNCSVIRAQNQRVFIGPYAFLFCYSFLVIQDVAFQSERK